MPRLPEVTFHIYPTDCDMLGHLNHATMLNFLERARWALLEPQIDIRNWAKQPVFSVVRHVDIGYLAQSLPGEDLVIRSGLLADQAHELHHQAGCAEGRRRTRSSPKRRSSSWRSIRRDSRCRCPTRGAQMLPQWPEPE